MQLQRWVSADPLAIHVSMSPGENEQRPEELASRELASSNVYAYVNGQVFTAVDVEGLFPTKNLAVTASKWTKLFEKKVTVQGKLYDRGGTTRGDKATNTLLAYGETTGALLWQKPTGKVVWMSGTTKKHPTAENARFVYTKKGGWIDMAHFMFFAGKALQNQREIQAGLREKVMGISLCGPDQCLATSKRLALKNTMVEARRQESLHDSHTSSYSYEDLPSDYYGADFALNHFDPNSKQTLSQQIHKYLTNLGAAKPQEAPNWADVPSGDPMSLPPTPPKNYTTKPMYTK